MKQWHVSDNIIHYFPPRRRPGTYWWDVDGMLFEIFYASLKYWKQILLHFCSSHFLFSSRFMLFPTWWWKSILSPRFMLFPALFLRKNFFFPAVGGGGGVLNLLAGDLGRPSCLIFILTAPDEAVSNHLLFDGIF